LKEGGQELSADARPLLFAAFSDQADVVKQLLDVGFDDQAIDHLILLELYQAAALRQLESLRTGKLSTSTATSQFEEEIPCPSTWEEQRRHEVSLSATFLERQRWEAGDVSYEQKYKMQMELVANDWKQMARDEQMEIAMKATSAVTWEKLPLVAGWSFQVIAKVNAKSTRGLTSRSLDDPVPDFTPTGRKDTGGTDTDTDQELPQPGATGWKPVAGATGWSHRTEAAQGGLIAGTRYQLVSSRVMSPPQSVSNPHPILT